MGGWRLATAAAVAVVAAVGGPVAADDLELSFSAGRVTVVAADVPLVAILDEWARLGDTRFVAGDGLPARAVSVRLVDVPEREALRVLLRAAGGYIAESRSASQPGVSAFERVLVMTGGRRRAARARPGPDRFLAPRAAVRTAPLAIRGAAAAAAAPGAPDWRCGRRRGGSGRSRRSRRPRSARVAAATLRIGRGAGRRHAADLLPVARPGGPRPVPAPQIAPQPGVIMQPADPAPRPRRPSTRPRR